MKMSGKNKLSNLKFVPSLREVGRVRGDERGVGVGMWQEKALSWS